jgi:penicillin-binding protein 2
MDKASSRLKVLALLVAMMFIALSTRLWFLQVLATTQFQKEARDNSVRFVYTEPLRGLIKDDRGHILVQNQESLEVRVNRDAMGNQAEAVVLRLSKLLHVEPRVLVARLQTNKYYSFQPIPVAEFVSPRVRNYIAEYRELFPGVEVVPTSVREYPYGRTAAHVLGYVGLISSKEYEKLKNKGYEQTDVIGRTGLEQVYEHYLRGTQGVQKFIVNSNGETIRALGVKDPTAGDDLHLTLDLRIQRAAERQLAEGLARIRTQTDSTTGAPLKANAGAVIVMDAQTGAIRAMASFPSYDPRWLVRGLTKSQAHYLYDNPAAPALNRAIQLGYVPGSTFKPITGLAALKEGFASLGGYYPCTSTYTHPGDTSGTVFHNWTTANLGSMSLANAIRISCDTVFDKFGSDFYYQYVQNQLNDNALALQNDLRQFGFGEPTGVDLPAEVHGLVPDPTWAADQTTADGKTKLFPDGFVPGIDILTMIGSSYVNASPLQLAQAYGAIANGGHLCRPHVVEQVVAPDGSRAKQPEDRCGRMIPYPPGDLAYIRGALGSVITSGTAACSFAGFPTSQVWVGGKTGTAERPPYQDTSWFAAMAGKDANSPKYVVVGMVEQGGFGAMGAAPIVRHVIEDIYGLPDTGSGSCSGSSDL